mgnify:CR=1 FL=1
MTRARVRLDELTIRGLRGMAPSPAEIERAVRDALARELAGAAPPEPRRIDRRDARVNAGSGLADAAGAAARTIAGSTRGSKP